MPAHVHAAEMLQYAKDAANSETPWDRWEYRWSNDTKWHPYISGDHPSWNPCREYRRKPDMIVVNGVEVPAPIAEAPPNGATVFIPIPAIPDLYKEIRWGDLGLLQSMFENGLVYLDRESAVARAKAMMRYEVKK